MLIKLTPILATLFLRQTYAFPYPLENTTTPSSSTICNTTTSLCDTNTGSNSTLAGIPLNGCRTVYPSDLSVVNSRYPDYDIDHLHSAKTFFMLRRQMLGDGEVAVHIQFQSLPANTTNTTCRLEFILPRLDLQHIQGPNPTFNVYQVEHDTDAVATWNKYEGNEREDVFGVVNGDPEALERTRSVGGVAAIGETMCNQTLTFQMGMAFDSLGEPNYWEFSNVSPPAAPVQGFRVVWGC
ncbi:hypothetical protein P153DRAFT_388742 [Dothidotthia symphoricarpi CBS 119687]|uniref:Ubiquitin 3 binding protein But2 C-terminal domain-containing protein n=1 Tax=Dothidotthia symphoricarpi CBS 119687 TaxID=1392245 RepID=A0A6A6A5D5_9PLEO|nr:uncharacterized protein P153DRAFT_388742 [Dothidotthia symphoricarpi CBS 119687]KAF2125988.1 hypothetical protein P153DRAFT_388742 [Dothidotthia symphoricarpi CBS 119687]